MFKEKEKPASDVLAMRGEASGPAGVERGPDGLPTAWRLLSYGPLSLTKDGKTSRGAFDEADADLICAAHKDKGVRLPIDSNHVMHALAVTIGKDERDIAAAVGGDALAMGFADIEKRADGLWLSGVSWTPIGAGLMREKAFRHFSPVFRGLSDGKLRVTSVSVLNYPAIDGQDAIACAGATPPPTPVKGAPGAAEAIPQPPPDAEDAVEEGAEDTLCDMIAEALGLPKGTPAEAIVKAVEGLNMRLKELAGQQAGMACAAEAVKRKAMISDALGDGRLSNALLPWANSQTSAALSAFLAASPRIVPMGRSATASIPACAARPPPHDPILSKFGVTEEDLAKFSKTTTWRD